MSGRHRSSPFGPGAEKGGQAPGVWGLALRQLRADPWVSLLLAVLVVVISMLTTVAPRVVTELNSRQVDYTVRELSVLQRDVRSAAVVPFAYFQVSQEGVVEFDSPEQTWAPLREGLERVRTDQPAPLRSLLQPGRFYVDVDGLRLAPDDPESDIARIDLQYRVDPLLPELVDLVEGDWPSETVPMPGLMIDGPQRGPGGDLEILLSADAADQLRWEVGEVREVADAGPTQLAGTYRPRDAEDPHWSHSTYGAELGVFFDANLGKLGKAAAYLAPGNPGVIRPGSSREFHLWYPLDAGDIPGDDVRALTAQLGALTAAQVTLVDAAPQDADPGPQADGLAGLEVTFFTEIFDTLRALSTQQRATASILAVVAAGPVGVALAVFALGARLIVTRRRAALALASARGGSPRQVRGVLAAEGALIGLPTAAAGYVVAGMVIPPLEPWPWPAVLTALLVGLVPSVVLALAPAPPSLREARSDLGSRGVGGRARWIAEVAIVSLAAVAVWRLLDRGLSGVTLPAGDGAASGPASADPAPPAVETGVDLLMAATPVLLALAAAVLTLRVYPVPLRVLTRALHSRTSLAPFLGAARSLRDPAGGLVPALAMILGIAVATFSTVLASTIAEGAQRTAWADTGAQVKLSGPRVSDDMVDTLRAVPGVASVARVAEASRTVNVSGTEDAGSVAVYVVDDTLAEVQAAAPLVRALPDELYAENDPLPVLAGGEVSSSEGDLTLSGLGSARVLGHLDELPGSATGQEFFVVARSAWESAGGTTSVGNLALLSVAQGRDRERVAEAVARAVPNSSVQTPQARLAAVQEAPVTSGLTRVLTAAVLLTTGLTVLTILLVQAVGAPSRARLLAVLRTLGTGPRQARALTGWELAPVLTVAFAVGALLGAVVPWLLLRAVDLRGLTGGSRQPDLSIDPVTLAMVALGVLVTVALAVIASAAIAARTDLAQHLRLGEER